jgi:hypothetical protein
MLKQISWTTYFEIILFLAAIWYVFVLFRYYRGEARKLNRAKQPEIDSPAIPEVLRYEPVPATEEIQYPSHDEPEDLPPQALNEDFVEVQKSIGQVKACIRNASGKPFSPAILTPQIKKLFREHPELLNSPQRPAINELVVQECESTGTALLTEDEVDQWWSD